MNINGREIRFKRTVMATCIIAERCPEGDIQRIGEAFANVTFSEKMMNTAVFVIALNDGYERCREIEEPGYKANPLTLDEVMLLDFDTIDELLSGAMAAFGAEKPTVETAPSKKNEA